MRLQMKPLRLDQGSRRCIAWSQVSSVYTTSAPSSPPPPDYTLPFCLSVDALDLAIRTTLVWNILSEWQIITKSSLAGVWSYSSIILTLFTVRARITCWLTCSVEAAPGVDVIKIYTFSWVKNDFSNAKFLNFGASIGVGKIFWSKPPTSTHPWLISRVLSHRLCKSVHGFLR